MKRLINKICRALLVVAMSSTAYVSAQDSESENTFQSRRDQFSVEQMLHERAERLQQEKVDFSAGLSDEGRADEETKDLHEIVIGNDDQAEENTPKASALGYASKFVYKTSHDGAMYSPALVSAFGDYVTLNDGLKYKVKPKDRDYVLNWLLTDIILILPPSWFSSYEYTLVNAMTGAMVEVTSVAPTAQDPYLGYWVHEVDYQAGRVCLQDGSIWSVSMFDSSGLKQWYAGDWVAIGINNDWLKHWNPNILINVNTNKHVRAKCTF